MMNRFRRGRNVSQWAGLQTGPMTVDVDAVWASHLRNPVPPRPVNAPVPHPAEAPAKYVSPLTAYLEYELNKTNASNQLAEATPPAGTSPAAALALVAEATEAAPSDPANAPTNEAQPTTEKPANLLDSLPALKAAMESFEKRGDPIMVSVDTQPPVEEPAAPAQSRPKPRKRPKRKPRPIPTLKQLTVRPIAPRPQSQPKSQAEIDLSHHQRRCSICHHPDREAIEEAFLQWCNIRVIQHEFKIAERAIYRHAHALKLFKQRNLSLRSALEFVIQKAEHVQPTAEGLVKAIHAYTRINDQGQWIDTPTTHIVKVMPMRDPEPRNVTPSASGAVTLDVKKISNLPRENRVEVTVESASGRPLLIDSALPTETRVTHSKQRKRKFLTGARTHIRIFGKLANSVSKIWRRSAQ